MIPRPPRNAACQRHRSAGFDVEDIEAGDRDDASWQHLDWCTECRRDLEIAAQTIVALRRIGKEVALSEPSGEAWPRLRSRVTGMRPAERWRPQLSLGGLVVAAALVATLAVPSTLSTNVAGRFEESSPSASLSRPADLIDARAEERWLRARPAGASDSSEPTETTMTFVFDQRRFGETILAVPSAAPQAKLQ